MSNGVKKSDSEMLSSAIAIGMGGPFGAEGQILATREAAGSWGGQIFAPPPPMSFDGLARFYPVMEAVFAGRKLQRCRTAYLDEIAPPRNVLLVGEGHGRCLNECRRRFPDARILCLDSSAKMIAQARRKLLTGGGNAGSVEFIHGDVRAWSPPSGGFDLIVTQFFLDCFPRQELEALIPLIAEAGNLDAHWLNADFQLAPTGWWRWRSRVILWLLYRFFRITTRLSARELVSPDPFFQKAGFHLHRLKEMEWGLLKSEWWQRDRSGSCRSRPLANPATTCRTVPLP